MVTRAELGGADEPGMPAGRLAAQGRSSPVHRRAGQMPAGPMKDGLLAMFADYTAHGFRGGNSLVLRTILGRAPRSLEDFFAELSR
jgi:hypothetical protein